MKVLGIGKSVIDEYYAVDTIASTQPKNNRAAQAQHIGGPVVTSMILLARLGADCTFLTCLGRDREGRLIKGTLEHEHVRVIENLQDKTKVNQIFVEAAGGRRKKVNDPLYHHPIKELTPGFIQRFDMIIVDRHEKEAFYEIVKHKKPSAKIVIDPSTEISDFTMDMIKYAGYPIVPIETLAGIGKDKNFEAALQALWAICQKPFTVTLGELGSLVCDGESNELVPALDIVAVDANGAGDIYRGGFAYGVLQGWSLSRSAHFGNLVAALLCTKLGNVAGIPTKQEIERYRDTLQPKQGITMETVINNYKELQK